MPDELKLLIALALNVGVFWAAWQFARRVIGTRGIEAAADAGLIWYAVQYLSVGFCGILGLLNAPCVIATAAALTGAMAWLSFRKTLADSAPELKPSDISRDDMTYGVGLLLCISAIAGTVYSGRFLPATANDSLTYHLPAAVQWMQDGRLSLYETWFYNPANTYSPLGGSVFACWLMLPMQNDAFARFMQAPGVVLLFLAVTRIARNLNARPLQACLLGLAVVLCRPMISQALVAKDDVFVAAFFGCAIACVKPSGDGDRFAPYRFGLSLGLLLAMKYTALLAVPALLLAVTVRRKIDWKHVGIVAAMTMLLAGPWFLRNVLATGNPLYPMRIGIGSFALPGLIVTTRTSRLSSPADLVSVTITGYYGLQWALAILLPIAWGTTCVLRGRSMISTPLGRLCLLGGPLIVATFLFTSPYAELRFVGPAIVLTFCAVAALPAGWIGVSTAGALAAAAAVTSFNPDQAFSIVQPIAVIACAAALVVAMWLLSPRRWGRPTLAISLGVLAGCWIYINWPSTIQTFRAYSVATWQETYGPQADVWKIVRDDLPPTETVAYTNTFFIYPLYGFDLNRRVVYAPIRPNVHRISDLPPIPERVSETTLLRRVIDITASGGDEATWRANLKAGGASYVVVGLRCDASPDVSIDPPELRWMEADPSRFARVVRNEGMALYRVLPLK